MIMIIATEILRTDYRMLCHHTTGSIVGQATEPLNWVLRQGPAIPYLRVIKNLFVLVQNPRSGFSLIFPTLVLFLKGYSHCIFYSAIFL